ncbi:MAG: penicillin-binding protein, partial [Erysipelotrichaceae bacterium]|nr:penicillin-binding protein [Erysipelotrichaceae bacterium]
QPELGFGTKRLDKETKEKIEKLKLPGIHFIDATNRNYPTTPFSSNLIGFASYDEDKQRIEGKVGLEKSLDKLLGGQDGHVQYQQTVTGEVLPGTTVVQKESEDGDNIVLTIDANLQATVESQMKATMENNNAESAWCVVMEVRTGKILAWASYPTFDQNKHLKIPSYIDIISESTYEPGSVMKSFTYATAIDTGVYEGDEMFRAGAFAYNYDKKEHKIVRTTGGTDYPIITDALGADFGTITFDQGLALSSNVGICELMSNYINYKEFGKYMDRFGFFKATDIPYVNEVNGMKNLEMPMAYLNSGFGQSSSITILQLCQAYTAIFNDGRMMRPYVVDSIIDSQTGEVVKQHNPKQAGQPISKKTAEKVRKLMAGVMETGATGDKFQMPGVDLIAKTGTGQIYDAETGQYDEDKYTSSIMAAAPGDRPEVMVYWGMVSTNYINYSAEPFQTIMQSALVAEGISGADYSHDDSGDTVEQWESYEMPAISNHSLDYAKQQLKGKDVHVVTIGNGDNVINQYPNQGDIVNSNDKVFVVTDGTTIKMPDMTGWTRKDITAFWQLTGISIETDGYGKVKEQNIEVDQAIDTNTNIKVKLE